jgi:hypothetical protein
MNLNIPIQEQTIDTFIPDVIEYSRFNDVQLKSAVENLVNTFNMDYTNNTIGLSSAPIGTSYINSIQLYQGMNFKVGSNTSGITYDPSATATKIIMDKAEFNSLVMTGTASINMASGSAAFNDVIVNGGLTVIKPIIASNPIIQSNNKISVTTSGASPTFMGALTLSSGSPSNIYLILGPMTQGAVSTVGSSITITINIDVTNPVQYGQEFTIWIHDIQDSGHVTVMNNITAANMCDLIFVPGNIGTTTNISIFGYTKNNVVATSVHKAPDTILNAYTTAVTLMYTNISTTSMANPGFIVKSMYNMERAQ